MRSIVRLISLCTALLALAPPAFAQDLPPPEEEEQSDESIVVTGTRVRQGGAQDIHHFRSTAADVGMPRPESGLVFNYQARGATLTMVHETSPVALYLRRVSSEATP